MPILPMLALLLAAAPPAPAAVVADPAPDAAHPAAMAAVQVPSAGLALNGVLYLASGVGPHPTLLLLHGFPGNEQNLDLAQAVRRAGWNVLTLHYRGSWGSPGAFSFANCAGDAQAALAWLRDPATAERYRIDARRVAVAGHSMGGMMAAYAAAREPAAIGTVLLDPWDVAATGRSFADPAARRAFVEGELRGDLPPLAGTSERALVAEIAAVPAALDLAATMPALATRPLLLIGADRAGGPATMRLAAIARGRAGARVAALTMPTDHSFSDHRIALESAVVAWLASLPGAPR